MNQTTALDELLETYVTRYFSAVKNNENSDKYLSVLRALDSETAFRVIYLTK